MLGRLAAALFLLVAGSAAALADDLSKDPAAAAAGSYKLETAHSQLLFAIGHIGLTDFYSRFDRLSGTLEYDPQALSRSSVSVTVQTGSVDTPSTELTSELAGPDVFDSQNYPAASFKSVAATRTGSDTGKIVGDLTIKDITKRITLDVVFTGTRLNPLTGRQVLGFRGSAIIKRSDFKLTGMMWEPLVSDDVRILIEAMFQKEN